MLNKLSIQEFEKIADQTAEETIKDIPKAIIFSSSLIYSSKNDIQPR